MNRRNFIKAASGGALLLGAAPSISHAGCRNAQQYGRCRSGIRLNAPDVAVAGKSWFVAGVNRLSGVTRAFSGGYLAASLA